LLNDVRGNVVIDYDKQGEIVKVNFYNFSFDLFKEYKDQINPFVRSSGGRVAVR